MKATIIYPGRFEQPEVFDFPIGDYLINPKKNIDFILDYIYRQCNHFNNEEWIHGKKLRSMSVGDMVLIEDFNGFRGVTQRDLFVCCMVGWKQIEDLIKTPKPWPEVKES